MMGTVFVSPYTYGSKNAWHISCFPLYMLYIDVGRSRGSNQVGTLFIYPQKCSTNRLEQFPIKGAKMRLCFWYVFTPPSSRKGLQGVFGHKWIKKSVYHILIHVYILYYYFYAQYMQLWCGGKAGLKWGGCGNG